MSVIDQLEPVIKTQKMLTRGRNFRSFRAVIDPAAAAGTLLLRSMLFESLNPLLPALPRDVGFGCIRVEVVAL